MSEALNPDDELERQLRGLTPRPAAVDRDRLMFESGRAAAGRSLSVWRGATAASLLLALGLGAFAGLRPPTERIVDRIVYMQSPVPPQPAPEQPAIETPAPPLPDSRHASSFADAAWSLRQRVLTEGIDALPPPPPVPVPVRGGLSLRDFTN